MPRVVGTNVEREPRTMDRPRIQPIRPLPRMDRYCPPGDVPRLSQEHLMLATLWAMAQTKPYLMRSYWRVVAGMPANGSRYA